MRLLNPARYSTFVNSLLCLVALSVSQASAQEEPDPSKVKGRIIGRVWHTKTNFGQLMNYTRGLGQELGLPQSPIMVMMAGRMGSAPTLIGSNPEDVELKGTAIFLETFPNAGTPHFVTFRKVRDLADFQKFVKQQAVQMGPMGEVIGEDDRFEVKMNFHKLELATPLPAPTPAGDGGTETRSVRIAVTSEVRLGNSAGVDFKMPESLSTYYRYEDGVMYAGQMKSLHFLDLPSSDSMQLDDKHIAQDIHGELDFTQIPAQVKQRLWMTLQSQTMTWMQKFDDEAHGDYSIRHALGQGRLELLKAAMFDVDSAEFSVKLPVDRDTPLKASLKIEAREKSQLAKSLVQMSRNPSRLGILRDTESPLVVSSTLDLPEWTQPLAAEFVKSIQLKMQESANETDQKLLDDLLQPVMAAIEDSRLDGIVRMEGDFDSGMVLAGGLRLPESKAFSSALETLLLIRSADNRFSVSSSKIGSIDVVTIAFDELKLPVSEAAVPVQIHLAGSGSYLWFSAGGTNALESLEARLSTQDSVLNAQTKSMPLHLSLKLSEWLNQDGEGVSRLPGDALVSLEKSVSRLLSPLFNVQIMINGNDEKPRQATPKFVSYAAKALADNGDVEITSETFGRTASLNAEIGTGVVRYILAQYAAAQSSMFGNVQFNFQPADLDGKGTRIRSIRIGN